MCAPDARTSHGQNERFHLSQLIVDESNQDALHQHAAHAHHRDRHANLAVV